MMDVLHVNGVLFIQYLQIQFKEYSNVMLLLTYLGDPRNAFIIYFPLAFYLNRSVGIRLLWAASISEWINALLKWVLHGHRPYWWIHETHLYNNQTRPRLDQFYLTCETGPGSPSGHAMVTASVLYLLIRHLTCHSTFASKHHRFVMNVLCWFGYFIFMFCVMISRLFIATHFPHQVVLGTFIGLIVAELIRHVPLLHVRSCVYMLVSAGLLLSGFAVYSLIENVLNMNPMWSVSSALKWCQKPEWIHLDTTLFHAIVRDSAALLGLGIALRLTRRSLKDRPPSLPSRIFYIAVAVSLYQIFDRQKLPQTSINLFYVLAFVKWFLMPVSTELIFPNVCDLLMKFVLSFVAPGYAEYATVRPKHS
ncbi:glucose-6-phosphatase 2-like [Tubulanus polymorphus]|uniref:glucose-6-phosphatase 2-like n=1 Tax=Tubulanus polymorphus TaxID=672921 RepID=UPI003DA23B11